MLYKQTMKILNAKGKKIKERETKRIKEKKRQTMWLKESTTQNHLKTKKGKQLYKTTLGFQ